MAEEYYILGLQTSLVWLISNGTANTKLAILTFLYCGKFLKNSNENFCFCQITEKCKHEPSQEKRTGRKSFPVLEVKVKDTGFTNKRERLGDSTHNTE